MNWRIKGLIQKTLSAIPGGVALNDLLQRRVGSLRNFDRNVDAKVNADWVVLMQHLRELDITVTGKTLVEIGTGWYPTLPVCFHLAGAGQVISYDLTRHLDPRLTSRMLTALEQHLPAITAAAGVSPEEVEQRYQSVASSGSRERQRVVPLAGARGYDLMPENLDYRAPADATDTGLPDNSVDIVFSNSVLEHVPREVIARLMRESRRILKPGGVSMHSVNCADHYAYFDQSITFMNYYRYTEKDWQFWNNDLQYQNRMRPQDFLELSEAAGLNIVLARHKPQPALLTQLPSLQLAPEFSEYPAEQLACTSVDFVGQKP